MNQIKDKWRDIQFLEEMNENQLKRMKTNKPLYLWVIFELSLNLGYN